MKHKPGEEPTLTLSDSDPPKTIEVESTVPIVCENRKCPVEVAIIQTHPGIMLSKCKLKFHCNNDAGESDSFKAVATRDFTKSATTKQVTLKFEVIKTDCSDEWEDYGNPIDKSVIDNEDEALEDGALEKRQVKYNLTLSYDMYMDLFLLIQQCMGGGI